jgi:VWFA-related protein
MPRRFVIVATVFTLALPAQTTFHANTQLVEINVVVRDKRGPVANLTKDDFTLIDAGKARSIALFSMNAARIAMSQHESPAPVEPGTISNRAGAPPNVTIILLDRLNTLNGTGTQPFEEHPEWSEELALTSARNQLLRFISTMGPDDRIALYSLGKSLQVLADFTGDRERLKQILEKYKPVSLSQSSEIAPLPVHTPVPGGFNGNMDRERQIAAGLYNGIRAETTFTALSEIAAHAAAIPGRKNLVWLTSNLPFAGGAAGRVMDHAGIAIYPVDARGLLDRRPPEQSDPGVNANVDFGRGPPSRMAVEPPGLQAMRDLADETGGRAFVNSNDLAGAVRAAVNDAEVSYTLGFYPEEAALDGKFHEIKIRVKHGSHEVRYPRGYFAMATEPVNGNRLLEAIASPLESAAIGLTAKIEREGSGELRISGGIDYADLALAQDGNIKKGTFEIYAVQQDGAGAILNRAQTHYDVRLTAELDSKYKGGEVPFTLTTQAKPGLATIRILATVPGNPGVGSLIVSVH